VTVDSSPIEQSPREGDVVVTDEGILNGLVRNINGVSVSGFLGVPYAEPPVGDLRFAAPVQKTNYGDYDATYKRPLCAQPMNCTGCEGYQTSEDCLYLNVFGPTDKTGEPMPVYYWIHGGSFTGDWHPTWYDGYQLVAHAKVVLVVVNYRVGALGFLSTSDTVARGNQGMLDQQLGLDWVQQNIHLFGGDKDKVTIHGQSAGAISSKYHSISPMSTGKFKNVIVHSGQQMAWNEHPEETAQSFARNTGCLSEWLISSQRFIKCVRSLPVDAIVEASDKEPAAKFNWSPVVDEKYPSDGKSPFLPEPPSRDYMNNRAQTERFNFMITTVTGEIAMGASTIRSERAFRTMMGPILGRLYNIDTDNEQFWIDLETFYLPNSNIEMARADDWRAAYITLGMDSGYTVYAYEIADAGRHSGAPFWLANFQFNPNPSLIDEGRVQGPWNEPWHGDDLMFFFGYVIESGLGNDEEVELSKKMMRLLGNFGRTGVAYTEDLDGEWLQFNPDADALVIDKKGDFSMAELWRTDAMVYWKTHLLPNYQKDQ